VVDGLAVGAYCAGAGVDGVLVVVLLCVARKTAPIRTTPTTPRRTGLGSVAIIARSSGPSLPLPPIG